MLCRQRESSTSSAVACVNCASVLLQLKDLAQRALACALLLQADCRQE